MLRIRDLAATRTRYDYFRIYILLRREGWFVNHKRVYRLYRDDGLSLRLKKPRRNVSAANRDRQPAATAANEMWSMDFVSDALFDGRRLRALTVVDAFTREALAINVDQGIKGEQVVEVMARISSIRGAPKTIRVDNGPEFISKALDRWAYENGVTLDFSRPGKPTDNAFVDAFIGRLRDECLNTHWFLFPGGCASQDRGLAARLQREPPSHMAWLADASRICCCRGQDRGRMNAGNSPSTRMRNRGTLTSKPVPNYSFSFHLRSSGPRKEHPLDDADVSLDAVGLAGRSPRQLLDLRCRAIGAGCSPQENIEDRERIAFDEGAAGLRFRDQSGHPFGVRGRMLPH